MKNNTIYRETAFAQEIDLFQIVPLESLGPLIPVIKSFFSDARTVLITGLSYNCQAPTNGPYQSNPFYPVANTAISPSGSIAPYTQANFYKIHHKAIKKFLQQIGLTNRQFRISVNSSLPEKAIGAHSGFALPGRHSILLTNELGSTFVLGITAIAESLTPTNGILFKQGGERAPLLQTLCTDCRQCETACPTSAVDNQNVDRTRCIQSLSSEATVLSRDIMTHWGRRFFGCSVCQDVCPVNQSKQIKPAPLPETGRTGSKVLLRKILTIPAGEVHNAFKGNQIGARWVSSVSLHRNALLALIHSAMASESSINEDHWFLKILRIFSLSSESSLSTVAKFGLKSQGVASTENNL